MWSAVLKFGWRFFPIWMLCRTGRHKVPSSPLVSKVSCQLMLLCFSWQVIRSCNLASPGSGLPPRSTQQLIARWEMGLCHTQRISQKQREGGLIYYQMGPTREGNFQEPCAWVWLPSAPGPPVVDLPSLRAVTSLVQRGFRCVPFVVQYPYVVAHRSPRLTPVFATYISVVCGGFAHKILA